MDAKQRRYDGIDFDQLYKRLRVYAEALTRFMPEVFDGVSAGDLVNDVLLAFWESPDGLGWKPAKGTLVTFLLTVLKNRFIDRYRRTQKMQGSLDDPDGRTPEPSCTPIDTLEYQDFLQQLRSRIGDRPDLQDLITATELIDSGHNVNQQLAALMGKKESEIVNLRRQLLNVTGVKKLYAQRRKT